jgi:rubrerythrin
VVRDTTSEKPSRKFCVSCVEEQTMQLATQISRRTRRGDARPAPEDLRASERLRAQRTPAPEDQALYRCECGYSFKADVSTSVGCPHCGTEQAW